MSDSESIAAAPDDATSVTARTRPEPSPATRRERAILVLATILGGIVTFAVYRPDRNLPFDFLDFSEFLPLLQQGSSFVDRLLELQSYYAGQGRFNVIAYLGIAAKWEAWGDNSIAWQWTRFATMWVAIFLAYRLLRRIGVSRLAAIASCAVIPFAPATVDAWLRLTATEPLGLVLLLIACLIALQPYGRKSSELSLGLRFATICVIVILLKEMLAASLLLPLLLVYADRTLTARTSRARLRTLLVAMIGAVPIAATPVVLIAVTASHDAYAAAFGSHIRPLSETLGTWFLSLLPFDPDSSFPPRLTGLALFAFLAILVAGWRFRLRMPNAAHGFRTGRLLLTAIFFSLAGALAYLPWPAFHRFYSFPYIVGMVILVAVAFEAIEGLSLRAFVVASVVVGALVSSAAADSTSDANRMAARQLANRAVVSRLAELRAAHDTVLVATNQRLPADWQELGPTLERFGRVYELDMPVVVNTPCEESRLRASSMHNAILAYHSHCDGFSAPNPIVVRYRRLRFPPLSIFIDSLRVDFVVPSETARGKR